MHDRQIAVAVLVALLFAGQAFALLHKLDLGAHHDGQPCELCLHLAVLDHGLDNNVSVTPFTAAPPQNSAAHFLPASTRTPRRYDSRAPPRAA